MRVTSGLDAPVSSIQVWSIAREAQRQCQGCHGAIPISTLSGSEKDDIKKTGVAITIA
jgi:hypothetical protein